MKKSQDQRILDYLLSGGKLTPIDALRKFGCFRLSARIYKIRKKHRVLSELVKVKSGKVVSEYSIPI